MEVLAAIEEFGGAIERNAATCLVGAGLSRGAGYDNWSELLKPFFAEFDLPEDFADLPLLAQYVINNDAGDRSRLVGHIVDRLNAVEAVPTVNHRLLAELPVPEFWTTNYDQLLEEAIGSRVVIDVDADFVSQAGGDRRVNKMHGSLRHGESEPVGGIDALVISRDDYDRYETSHPRASRLLQAQFLTKSFLFLGFSMTDPNFDAVFRLARTATADRSMPHYAMLKGPTDADRRLFDATAMDLERSGIHVVEIEDYDQITDFLTRLVARARPIRLYISGSPPETGDDGVGLDGGGSYPAAAEIPDDLAELAAALGSGLARAGIRVATGSLLGATCGYGLIDALEDYDPDRLWLLRRHNNDDVTAPCRRQGTIKFIGTAPNELRDQAFLDVRAVLVLGGGNGTALEADLARSKGMGVVPVACSGGTALELWTEMNEDLSLHTLGGRPIDPEIFKGLIDPELAIDAAVALVSQALFIPADSRR